MYIKSATSVERKKRVSVLVQREIKFILKNYHDTLLHYRDLGDVRVEVVLQSPWTELYEALNKEHQENGAAAKGGNWLS